MSSRRGVSSSPPSTYGRWNRITNSWLFDSTVPSFGVTGLHRSPDFQEVGNFGRSIILEVFFGIRLVRNPSRRRSARRCGR